jgi:hypothetical protein
VTQQHELELHFHLNVAHLAVVCLVRQGKQVFLSAFFKFLKPLVIIKLVWNQPAYFVSTAQIFVLEQITLELLVNILVSHSNDSPPQHLLAVFVELDSKLV